MAKSQKNMECDRAYRDRLRLEGHKHVRVICEPELVEFLDAFEGSRASAAKRILIAAAEAFKAEGGQAA